MVVEGSVSTVTKEMVEKLLATLTAKDERITGLENQVKLLQEKIHLLTARRFGASSERFHPDQGTLFLGDGEKPEVAEAELLIPAHRRRKKRHEHGRSEFPEHLPRNHIPIDPPQQDRVCSCCGTTLICIRREITERGDVIPTRIVVNQYDRGVWACACGDSAPLIGELPKSVVEKAKWEPSAYAHLVCAKYADHTPLHRLMGIFRRHGIHFSKSTMWDLIRSAGVLLAAIVGQMRRELLAIRLLSADETPIRVMMPQESVRKKTKRKVQTGYMWTYGAFDEGKILFDFTTNRSRAGPCEFLAGWSGTLVADEYSGYDEVCRNQGIVRAACWSHGRRKIKDALDAGSRESVAAMVLMNRLFRLEEAYERHLDRRDRRRRARGEVPLGLEERASIRLAARHRWSLPAVVEIAKLLRSWKRDPDVLPKSLLGQAVTYLIRSAKIWKRFTLFLKDGRVPLHNNAAENAIRPIAIGRKNWLVAGSVVGGDTGATLYSLLGSCKAIGVNPEEYLCDVLAKLRQGVDVARLTPWGWKAERESRKGREAGGDAAVD